MGSAARLADWRTCPRCGAPLDQRDDSVACPSCGFEYYENPAPTASALVEDGDGRILLARRARDPGRGLWDLLGGFVDCGEEPLETLRREIHEEAGVELDVGDFLGGIPDRYGDDGVWTVNLYWAARVSGGEPRPADDVAELEWWPRDGLPSRDEFAFRNTIVVLERAGGLFRERT